MKMVVNKKKCTGSSECVRVCPHNAIAIIDGKAVIDQERCDFDGLCIPACPNHAIGFEEEENT
jgi:NAD-dependent dihydropyrimidine dehydrogenase PreA subunit